MNYSQGEIKINNDLGLKLPQDSSVGSDEFTTGRVRYKNMIDSTARFYNNSMISTAEKPKRNNKKPSLNIPDIGSYVKVQTAYPGSRNFAANKNISSDLNNSNHDNLANLKTSFQQSFIELKSR